MPSWWPHIEWYWWALATLVVLVILILEGSYRALERGVAVNVGTNHDVILAAHTEEMRLTRLAHERENSPIQIAFRKTLNRDPSPSQSVQNDVSRSAPSRIELKYFIVRAGAAGWDISGQTNIQIMELLQGVRQAALDGVIRTWGRRNRNKAEQLNRLEPLLEIERIHWAEYEIDVHSVITSEDNFGTTSSNKRASDPRDGGFLDLHVESLKAELWLKGPAERYKGTRNR